MYVTGLDGGWVGGGGGEVYPSFFGIFLTLQSPLYSAPLSEKNRE